MYLYGASGHGKVIEDILTANAMSTKCFIDDNKELIEFSNKPVFHSLFASGFDIQKDRIIISIGNNLTRKRLSEKLKAYFGRAIHPTSAVSKRAVIGDGTVIMANSTVNTDVIIGQHCIINTNASIDHDCEIGDFVHISPNVAIAGDVHVGEGTHLGIGSCVIQGIRIGKWAIVGAGTVVIKNVPDFAVVVGNPGRVLKFRTDIK